MARKRKRKINIKKSLGRILLLAIVIIGGGYLIINLFSGKKVKSINNDAKKYKNKTCTVFYPNNNELKRYAKEICDNSIGEEVYDYALIPYGDYSLVTYSNGTKFLIDKENKPLVIDSLSNECKEVISDYLRYDMQKEELDEAYTVDFYEKTYYKNLDISNAEVSLDGTNILVYLPEFDRTVSFPIFNVQDYLGIDLGPSLYKYVKPHYVSPNRKTAVFTFNDGPSIENSTRLIDTLYKYGANATFFILGNRVNQEAVDMMKDSIEKGNEYGSHTENCIVLTGLSDEEIYYEIMSPADVLAVGYKDDTYDIKGINYNMKYYRAPLDIRDERVNRISPLMSIRWDIDSFDWLYRDGDYLYNYIMQLDANNMLDRQIIIIHDCYPESVDATNKAIVELVDKGYQFVNITEFLNLINFDFSRGSY